MSKLLLAIQFWEGDKQQAMQLMRLIADLQEGLSTEADVLFSARFDCQHDMQTVYHVQRKFVNVHTYNSDWEVTGHPQGCNALWQSTMRHVWQQVRRGNWDYEAVFTFEADCTPTAKDWISRLVTEWHSEGGQQWVCGHLMPFHGYHVNGNMLCRTDLPKLVPAIEAPCAHNAWDLAFYRYWKDHVKPSREIVNCYRHTPGSADELFGAHWGLTGTPLEDRQYTPCVYHGDRTTKSLEWARERLLPKT